MLVRVRNPQHARAGVWFFDQPLYFEYSGEEVRVKHVKPTELALTTGNPEWPIRVIQRSHVVSIDGQAYTQDSGAVEVRMVKGSKGQEYTVTNRRGQWHCTCTGFQFRNACKHTAQ